LNSGVFYYELLSVSPDASPEEVKRAYHRTAKANHPDLFPESERHVHELMMMRINEAYMAISQGFKAAGFAIRSERPATPSWDSYPDAPDYEPTESGIHAATTSVGFLKDPAYVYYKRGFEYYKKGYGSLYERTKAKNNTDLVKMISTDSFILRLSIQALQYFQKSYESLHHVTLDYPDSVWSQDALFKIRKIEGFNRIYQRICQNITEAIKQKHTAAHHKKPASRQMRGE